MTPLREVRLKEYVPVGVNSQVVSTKTVELLFDAGAEVVYAKRRDNGAEYIIPRETIAYMIALEPLLNVFTYVHPVVVKPVVSPVPEPVAVKDDTVKFVKKGGKIVETSLAATLAAARAEADEG